MYSSKEQVNILTSLLMAHGIRHAVVCPGSRNAPIVHNLHATDAVRCYPVTDERSAGFYALGMAAKLCEPVVVCVTSGTALLNVAPAVAEAYYRRLPLVVVSADRPPQWIDQCDGQTLQQPDALGRFVSKAVTLPEPHDAETRWYCNRLVNEALMECHAPVHINVPISEPLFDFSVPALPAERVICRTEAVMSAETQGEIVARFFASEKAMLIDGQPINLHYDEAVGVVMDDERYQPDFILYTGGAIVSKRLKQFLRKAKGAETWVIGCDGGVADTFQNTTRVVQGDAAGVVAEIRARMAASPTPFGLLWTALLSQAERHADEYEPPFSQMAAVKYFEQQLDDMYYDFEVHYGNSMAIRLANIYARHHVWCNRGVNGIEGSLSAACGMSVVTAGKVFCVLGDLSFFYDQNALWNQNLGGNLRILLMNNGGGAIFRQLRGLEQSAAAGRLVAAAHATTAQGICTQNDIGYLAARNMADMQLGIVQLLTAERRRPMLLEVFTDADEDMRAYQSYLSGFRL